MNPFYLKFQFQNYAWGKPTPSSLMYKLGILPNDLPAEERVAEAWAGAHPSKPALLEDGTPLNRLIQEHPIEVLGERVANRFGNQLPFLFKLLSIGAPLSIQVHPDRRNAELLHQRFPERYPESNHKPEVGVAVTETKLLFGFRPLPEILAFIEDLGPLRYLVGEDRELKGIFQRILHASDEERLTASDSILELLRVKPALSEEERLFIQLDDLYPGDPGVFQVFILNLLTLNPGDSLFIPPNTPHAYLSGDIVECMATSDFVIRAGLTPKVKDLESLCEVVEYQQNEPINNRGAQKSVEEYSLEILHEVSDEFSSDSSPVLYFVLDGKGEIKSPEARYPLETGNLLFLPASVPSHQVSFKGKLFRVCVPK
jgi:mannose-6-phosphate isomerase